MHLCASMQNHLIKNYNASENLCLCLSPGSMRCLRTERDQRKDNSGRATESCAAYSTHCNICQEIFFGPHHSSPLWVNTSVPILMNHKWWPYGALDQHSPATAEQGEGGWKRLRMLYQMDFTHLYIQKTKNPASGKSRASLFMCVPILATIHLRSFCLSLCLPVSKSHYPSPPPLPIWRTIRKSSSYRYRKTFKNSDGALSTSDSTSTDRATPVWCILHKNGKSFFKMEHNWLVSWGRVHMDLTVRRETKFPGCSKNKLWTKFAWFMLSNFWWYARILFIFRK